jgi:hypothetical protein
MVDRRGLLVSIVIGSFFGLYLRLFIVAHTVVAARKAQGTLGMEKTS